MLISKLNRTRIQATAAVVDSAFGVRKLLVKVPTAFTTRFNNNEKSVSTMNHHLQTKILIKMEVVDSSNHVPVKRKTKRLRRPKKRNGLVKRKPNEMLAQATTIFLEWKDLFDPQTIRKKKTLSKGNM